MRRIISLTLAVMLFLSVPYTVLAEGFIEGDYTDSKVIFGFEPSEAVLVYNGEVYQKPDYEEIWPGSSIYVPVYSLGSSGNRQKNIATDKLIKDNEVTVSYKATQNARYIDAVELVDGKKEKIKDLDAGIYAKISINNAFAGTSHTKIALKLVLSVKRISYPESQIELDASLYNRIVDIDQNTVYGAQSPTQFGTILHYNGPASFDFGNKIIYNTTVQSTTRYYLNLDRSDQTPIKNMYPNAYLEFYNFKGDRDSFASTGTLEIPINRTKFKPKKSNSAQVFAYEIVGDKLVALDERSVSFDGKKNILYLKTSVLGNYVLTSEALLKNVEDDTDDILFTGYAPPPSSMESTTASSSAQSAQTTQESKPSVINDNINTGLAINASNVSADNPLTSDGFSPYAVIVLIASGILSLVLWKSGWFSAKKMYN